MGGSGSALFADADAFQAHLPVTTQFLVTRPGRFRARLTWMELTDLHLLLARETMPRIAYVSLPTERVFIVFPTHRTSTLICDGVKVQMGDLIFHRLGERFHQRTTNATVWGTIALPPAWLRAYGRTLAEQDVVPPPFGRILRPLAADRKQLLRLHAEAVRLAETRLSRIEHPEVARALEQDLIWALVSSLTNAEPRAESLVMRRHAGVMAQFEQGLIGHLDPSPPLAELQEAIGASERTLRTACLALLGMGPARYLHLRILERVRLALLHASSGVGQGTEVMKRHGFAELHHFMTAYRDAFGQFPHINREQPSDRRI
jgi:AraC-like DNA-binding protein